MPLIKNAVVRYYLINECLTQTLKRYWTLEEIMELAEERDIRVTKRTLEMDIQAMRYDERLKYRAPIVYCKRNKGFHYTDPNYSIDKLPLTADDIEMFDTMIESFQRFRGAQALSPVEGMFDKLGKVVDQLKPRKTKTPYPIVLFEKIPYAKGAEHFNVLYEAIAKQKPLVIDYKRFDKETMKTHVFHPYLLKEYKFRWYVLGYSENRHGKLILALDRIETIAVKKIQFRPYKGIDVQKYFDHTLGVTINTGGVKEIRLWFSVLQGNYIKTQHLHDTQQFVSDDNSGMIITLKLIPNYELLQTLLGFGAECKVLEPLSLQEELKAMLRKSMALYGE